MSPQTDKMASELLQSLEDVGYSGALLDIEVLKEAIQEGTKSTNYTGLVSWLTGQIGLFGNFDETVHPTSSAEDASTFLLELSSFLKELGCINSKLTSGNANQRLASVEERSILLEYLITELMTSKIIESNNKDNDKSLQITISESITAKNMREMLSALRFQKPPDDISPDLLFKKLHTKVMEVLKQVPKELVGKPLFFGELNNDQWEKLNKLQADLNEEYTIRREMLLKRLDVTVNSFAWSERIRPKENELNKCYHAKRDAMSREPDVMLAHLLAARDDLAIIEKTSNASVRKNTKSAINSVIIGAVPDRGGRSWEQEPPPPEMPPWQKDKVPTPQRGGFGGGRGGGRGGGGGGGGGRGRGGNQGGGFRDNKSAASNFGQNFDNSSRPPSQSFNSQNSGGYGNKPTYSNQSTGYSNTSNYGDQQSTGYSQNSGYGGNKSYSNSQSSGYAGSQGSSYSSQSSNYGNQGSTYSNQSSNYGNQGYEYGNQGGYDRKSGGDYNRSGGRGQQNRGGRVQGSWNQGGSSNYNQQNQGQGGGRRY